MATTLDKTDILSSYTYIVVGAGTSGCVIANRLSENGKATVLLLEAGIDDRFLATQVPALVPTLQKNPEADWMFRTERNANQNDRVSVWPRGKMLGGCSSNNYMLWVRGNRAEYDMWEKEFGCEGWGYDKILPLFQKIEQCSFNSKFSHADPKYRGFKGPLKIRNFEEFDATNRFVAASQQVGIPFNKDYNGEDQIGVSYAQATIADGKRQSASVAYLHPILNRKNLTVACKTQVTKLVIENGRCVGVEYRRPSLQSPTKIVKCSSEVIVCGGAVGSPHLLMLSGIGPRAELGKFNIPVVQDLPGVGKNMQDHLFTGVSYEMKSPISVDEAVFANNPHLLAWNVVKYLLFKTGVLASQSLESMAFLKTRPDVPWPDLQMHFVNAGGVGDPEKTKDLMELEVNTDDAPTYAVTALPSLLHPKSRGEILLASADPEVKPIIRPNYLTEEEDMRVLVEGLKLAKKILQSKAFDDVRGRLVVSSKILKKYPDPNSEEYLRETVRESSLTIYHPTSTCMMGRIEDPMVVCDPSLRVKGIAGLRVADCSIMPTLSTGNTQAPAFLVGEKASELILKDQVVTPSAKL